MIKLLRRLGGRPASAPVARERLQILLAHERAIGGDLKGKASLAAYVLAVPLAFVNPLLAVALYVLTALAWLVPDRRIEARSSI